MLYRNPDSRVPASPSRWFARLGMRLERARRRRLASLDLLTLGDHLRRDLGLVDNPLPRRLFK